MSFLETRLGEKMKFDTFIRLLTAANEILLRKKVMSRILITGASGNVGKYVAAYALKMDRGLLWPAPIQRR